MTAIITDKLKKQILLGIAADIDSADNNYFVGLGRSEIWDASDTTPVPNNTTREQRNLGLSLQSIKIVADKSLVIPRYNWSSGAIYANYNDNIASHPTSPYYVFTDENHVYICLQPGRNAAGTTVTSTVKPTGTPDTAFKTADGYVWKFLYSIGALSAAKFVSANFIPVDFIVTTDGDSPASIVEQKRIQDAATSKEVVGYTVINGGSGYTSTPTATIVGNGSGAKAAVTVSGGAVSKVDVHDSGGAQVFGTGYSYADVVISGGGGAGAIIRPIIGPDAGFGADPRDDLRARAIMFNAKPDGTEADDFVVGNDFRQVALIKNPLMYADSDFTENTGNALRSLNLATIATAFSADKTIQGATSAAKAYIDKVDGSDVYYHQNETTGFVPFTSGESISETDGAGSGVLSAGSTNGEFNPLTGDILYIDNRAAVTRSANQTEDIKIVIQI